METAKQVIFILQENGDCETDHIAIAWELKSAKQDGYIHMLQEEEKDNVKS